MLASIYFAVMGLFSLISCMRIRFWPTTSGVLLHSGLDTLGLGMRSDEHNYTADVRYSYRVAGKDYEGNRLSPTLVMMSTNLRFVLNWQMKGIKRLGVEQVVVLYNLSKPEKSFLIRPGMATFFLPLVFILISVIFLIMSI